jgi:hypothetical protein
VVCLESGHLAENDRLELSGLYRVMLLRGKS